MMSRTPWYKLQAESEIDSPALIIYRDRVRDNIDILISSIDQVSRLRPHVKTHKSREVAGMFIEKGITKFKCATIAEAEMLANAGASDILLAYQPVGPKSNRLLDLISTFPQTIFSCLLDNVRVAMALSQAFYSRGISLQYFIDVNVGMNRTGIIPDQIPALYDQIRRLKGLRLRGLHIYDGHIRDQDFAVRTSRCNEAFDSVLPFFRHISAQEDSPLTIVAGGTPTFSVHAKRKEIECSPGTFVYWDKGYENLLREQTYLHAAVVLTRVISKPAPGIVCIDLGHKSIASENALENRVCFLNAPDLKPIGHSEEHMVLETNGTELEVGDTLYGIPYHICPTVALYESTQVAAGNAIVETWQTLSRNRKISV